jgi:hypothetical protein
VNHLFLAVCAAIRLVAVVELTMGDTTEASPPQTRRRAQDFVRWEYKKEPIPWRPTTAMNVRDLSNDDDFLSHILVEKLGANIVPLLVHRMDSSRQLPKASADELLAIVRKVLSYVSQSETPYDMRRL